MSKRTWSSFGVWALIVLMLWTVAWIIAEAIPVFNDLLGLISALFASWFTYGLSGVFWLFLNRGRYTESGRKMVLTGVNVGLFLMGAVIVSFSPSRPRAWFFLRGGLFFSFLFFSFPLFFGKNPPLTSFPSAFCTNDSAGSDSTRPGPRSTPTPRAPPGAASPATITLDRRLLEILDILPYSNMLNFVRVEYEYSTIDDLYPRRRVPNVLRFTVLIHLPLCDLI